MTEQWLTAREIADLKLPGLATNERNVRKYLARIGAPAMRQSSTGGRPAYAYPISALPDAARKALARRALQTPAAAATAPDSLPIRVDHLKSWQRETMDARAALLAEVERLQLAAGLGRGKAVEALVEQARDGSLRSDLAALISQANARAGKGGGRTLCRATVYNWFKERDAAGAVALAPREAASARPIVPEWVRPFWSPMGAPPKAVDRPLPGAAAGRAAAPMSPSPSYDQVKRFLRQMSVIDRNRGRIGPRQLKTMRAYVTRDFGDLWPTAIYVADGHTFDAEVAHPIHGQPFRPEVTVVIDVATRVIVGWSIGIVENTWGVADALRHACETWGVPALWYVDRGKGFNNAYFDGPHTGFLARLGVHKENSLPLQLAGPRRG